MPAAGAGPTRLADLRRAGCGRRTARPRSRRPRGRNAHRDGRPALAKVANLLRNTFNLNVTPGGLARLLHRAARDATPAYQELCEQVRNAPVVTPDETGWRVGGGRHWLWAYATADTTVYAICPGRGFDDAATVLGTDYAGVLVRDGWQVYRCYKDSLHQSCINHLLRRAKALQEDHPYSPWGAEVKAVLQAGLDVRDRCQNGELTRRGLDVLRGRLEARLGRLIDAPPPLEDAKRFARHLANEFPAVFLFLRDPSIDATNWRPNRRSGPRWSSARCAAATAPAVAPTPSRCCPVWYAPPANVALTCLGCSLRCCVPPPPSSLKCSDFRHRPRRRATLEARSLPAKRGGVARCMNGRPRLDDAGLPRPCRNWRPARGPRGPRGFGTCQTWLGRRRADWRRARSAGASRTLHAAVPTPAVRGPAWRIRRLLPPSTVTGMETGSV